MGSFDSLDRMTVQPEREKVIISRYWNHPRITVTVNKDRIAIITDLDTFLKGVLEELQDPSILYAQSSDPEKGKSAWMWIKSLYPRSFAITHEQLKWNILNAANRALEKIKEATNQVM